MSARCCVFHAARCSRRDDVPPMGELKYSRRRRRCQRRDVTKSAAWQSASEGEKSRESKCGGAERKKSFYYCEACDTTNNINHNFYDLPSAFPNFIIHLGWKHRSFIHVSCAALLPTAWFCGEKVACLPYSEVFEENTSNFHPPLDMCFCSFSLHRCCCCAPALAPIFHTCSFLVFSCQTKQNISFFFLVEKNEEKLCNSQWLRNPILNISLTNFPRCIFNTCVNLSSHSLIFRLAASNRVEKGTEEIFLVSDFMKPYTHTSDMFLKTHRFTVMCHSCRRHDIKSNVSDLKDKSLRISFERGAVESISNELSSYLSSFPLSLAHSLSCVISVECQKLYISSICRWMLRFFWR